MSPPAMASPTYDGPKALGLSRYANAAQQHAQLAAASSFPVSAPSIPETAIATRQQIAALVHTHEATPPTAELAIEQGTVLKKEVQDHTVSFSRAVSNAVVNTRQLLILLRESNPGSKAVDDLWQELEQLFEAVNKAKAALPDFMGKQRDNMSLYHSAMMNETIREAQEELNLQHRKVNTQHNLILEQQDAFKNYKAQTASKLKELEGLHERVSRLTLEKGNFRTEVDKYKQLLEMETVRKVKELATADAIQKELETFVASKKLLKSENETLRKTTTEILEQLKTTEDRVTERFEKELAAKAEELRKESTKMASLNTLISSLKSGESATKKELDKVKNENRLLSVKYTNQVSEHAAAFSVCILFTLCMQVIDSGGQKSNEHIQKIEALTVDVGHLQKQNADLRSKLKDAAELTEAKTQLSKEKDALTKEIEDLALQVEKAADETKTSQAEVQKLRLELDNKEAAPAAGSDKAIVEKLKATEEKNRGLELTLSEWQELAKVRSSHDLLFTRLVADDVQRSYKEYKDTLLKLRELEKRLEDAAEKDMQIADLKQQLADAKISKSNGVSATAGGDSAYWKQKYETLLANL